MTISDDVVPAFELAYSVYQTVFTQQTLVSERCRKRYRRQLEGVVGEAGFRGVKTGLISVKALETIVEEKKGIHPTRHNRVATEHPIPPRVIADYILDLDYLLSFDEFFGVWFKHYVSTKTTNEENQRLKTFQASFKLGDCWKEMYSKAGIELVERPNFQRKAVKQQYGIVK